MHHRFAKANCLTQLLKIKRSWGVLTTRSLSVCLFLSNFLSIRKPRGWRSSFIEAHWIPPMKIQTKSVAENNHQILSRSFKLSMGSPTNDWAQNAWRWLQGSSSRRIWLCRFNFFYCGALNVLQARISHCYGDSWWITRANTRPAPRIQSAKWGSKACSPWSNRSGSHSYLLDVSATHLSVRILWTFNARQLSVKQLRPIASCVLMMYLCVLSQHSKLTLEASYQVTSLQLLERAPHFPAKAFLLAAAMTAMKSWTLHHHQKTNKTNTINKIFCSTTLGTHRTQIFVCKSLQSSIARKAESVSLHGGYNQLQRRVTCLGLLAIPNIQI